MNLIAPPMEAPKDFGASMTGWQRMPATHGGVGSCWECQEFIRNQPYFWRKGDGAIVHAECSVKYLESVARREAMICDFCAGGHTALHSQTCAVRAFIGAATAWIEKAKSNDKTRINLTKTFAVPGFIAATDGHRAHLMPDAAQKYYTPNVPQVLEVIPEGEGVVIDGKVLKKAIQIAVKMYEKQGRSGVPVRFMPYPNALQVIGFTAGKIIKIDGKVPRKLSDRAYENDIPGWNTMISAGDLARYPRKADDCAEFNGLYLLDALGARLGDIRWFHADPRSPLKITHADGRIAIVMPRGV